jgi:hypothetical protein
MYAGISQHFHDDSTAFQMHGKWWIFMVSEAPPAELPPIAI